MAGISGISDGAAETIRVFQVLAEIGEDLSHRIEAADPLVRPNPEEAIPVLEDLPDGVVDQRCTRSVGVMPKGLGAGAIETDQTVAATEPHEATSILADRGDRISVLDFRQVDPVEGDLRSGLSQRLPAQKGGEQEGQQGEAAPNRRTECSGCPKTGCCSARGYSALAAEESARRPNRGHGERP